MISLLVQGLRLEKSLAIRKKLNLQWSSLAKMPPVNHQTLQPSLANLPPVGRDVLLAIILATAYSRIKDGVLP
jgi:hypothetical protein